MGVQIFLGGPAGWHTKYFLGEETYLNDFKCVCMCCCLSPGSFECSGTGLFCSRPVKPVPCRSPPLSPPLFTILFIVLSLLAENLLVCHVVHNQRPTVVCFQETLSTLKHERKSAFMHVCITSFCH